MFDGARQRIQALAAQTAGFPRIWRLVWNAAPGWTVGWAVTLIALGLAPLATVALSKRLVDALVSATRAGVSWQNTKPAVIAGVLIAVVSIASDLLQGLLEWVRTVQTELMQDHIASLIHRQSITVDLAFYESPEYFDCLYRARDEATARPAALLDNLGAMLQNSVTVAGFAGLVLLYGPLLLLAMILSILPAVYVVVRYNWLQHDWWHKTTSERRWIQYYDQKFTLSACAAELRLLGLGNLFHEFWKALRVKLRGEKLRLIRRQSFARIGAGLLSLSAAAFALAWMSWRTLHGSGTLGDIILFYQALMGGQSLMRAITGNFGNVYSNSLFLGNLFDFLDLRPQVVDPPHPVAAPSRIHRAIRFDNVTFRYPGAQRPALENFNLTIPAGKVVAIVGPNGAGKSTLLKLLARFYDPVAGSVTIDGVDLRQMPLQNLRQLVSILFQLPVTYDATATDNIAFGDLALRHDAADIRSAAVSAGAHDVISRLPRAYDTVLGKTFAEGVDLSAGEWQRIAMARAFLRRAPLLLLDEPTSFMDSWAEAEWFERLRRLAVGATCIVITHRFTIAMRADLIHVMRDGRVLESGTHHQLLAADGFYAESWKQQMEAVGGEGALASSIEACK